MPESVGPVRRVWRRVVPRSVRRAVRPAGSAPPVRLGPDVAGGLDRIHVGCGPHNLMADWWNVDIREFPGVDEVADMTVPWPWHAVGYVYGEHFLEHLPLDGTVKFLTEAAAALRPGGRIRLSTPGLEWVWRTHFDGSAAEADVIARTYQANRAFHGWGHQFLYSRPMLEHVLRGAGFTDVTFHDYGTSEDPSLRGLERHPGWEIVDGWPNVWIVEATPGGVATTADLMAEVDHEMERYRRSGH